MSKMIMVETNLKRFSIVPEGFIKNLLYTKAERFDYVSKISEKIQVDADFERDMVNLAYSVKNNEIVKQMLLTTGLSNIIKGKQAVQTLAISALSNYYSLIEVHGLALNDKLLIGQNRGFELRVLVDDINVVSIFLPGAFIRKIRESIYCIGATSDGSTFVELAENLNSAYKSRESDYPLAVDLFLSVFGKETAEFVGPGAVYAVSANARDNYGIYEMNAEGNYELALEFLYIKNSDINRMMEETNKSYQLLVESFTSVMPGLSDALMIRSRAIEELNSAKPLFLVQSGATRGDRLKTGSALQAYVNNIDGIRNDAEVMEISNVFSSLLSFGELAQITDNGIEVVGAEAFSVNDVLTTESDYVRLKNGFIPRALSNVFTSRVEEIITDVNTKTYDKIGLRLEEGDNTEADYELIRQQAERAVKEIEVKISSLVSDLSSSSYEQLSASLLDLRRDYDQKIAIISETMGQSLQLTAKAAEMLSLVNNIINYPVVSGKYGQILGTIADYLTQTYDPAKRLFTVSIDADAIYAALGRVALRTSDARGSGRLFKANLGDVNNLGGYDGSEHSKIYPDANTNFTKEDLNKAESGKPIIVFDSVSQAATKSWYNVGARELKFQQAIRQTQKINSKTVEIVPNVISTVPSGCYIEEFTNGIARLIEAILNHEAMKAAGSIFDTLKNYTSILNAQKEAMKSLSVQVAYLKAKNSELGVNRFLLDYYKQVEELAKSGLSPVKVYTTEGEKFSYLDYLNFCSLLDSSKISIKLEPKDEKIDLIETEKSKMESYTEDLKKCSNVYDTFTSPIKRVIIRKEPTGQGLTFEEQAYTIDQLAADGPEYSIMNIEGLKQMDDESFGARFHAQTIFDLLKDGNETSEVVVYWVQPSEEYILCNRNISGKTQQIPLLAMKNELLKKLAESKKIVDDKDNYICKVYEGDRKVETDGEIFNSIFTASYEATAAGIDLKSISKRKVSINKTITLLGYNSTLQRILSISNTYYLPTAMKTALRQQIARAFKFETVADLKKNLGNLDLSFLTKQEEMQLRNLVTGNDVKIVSEEPLLLAILASSLLSDVTYANLLSYEYKNASSILSREACGLLTEVKND